MAVPTVVSRDIVGVRVEVVRPGTQSKVHAASICALHDQANAVHTHTWSACIVPAIRRTQIVVCTPYEGVDNLVTGVFDTHRRRRHVPEDSARIGRRGDIVPTNLIHPTGVLPAHLRRGSRLDQDPRLCRGSVRVPYLHVCPVRFGCARNVQNNVSKHGPNLKARFAHGKAEPLRRGRGPVVLLNIRAVCSASPTHIQVKVGVAVGNREAIPSRRPYPVPLRK